MESIAHDSVLGMSEDRARGWQGRIVAARKAAGGRAAWLEARGWVCIPPEHVTDEIRALTNRESPDATPSATSPIH